MALHMFSLVDTLEVPDQHLFKKITKTKRLHVTGTTWLAWIMDPNSSASLLFRFECADEDGDPVLPEGVKIQWPERGSPSAVLNLTVRFDEPLDAFSFRLECERTANVFSRANVTLEFPLNDSVQDTQKVFTFADLVRARYVCHATLDPDARAVHSEHNPADEITVLSDPGWSNGEEPESWIDEYYAEPPPLGRDENGRCLRNRGSDWFVEIEPGVITRYI